MHLLQRLHPKSEISLVVLFHWPAGARAAYDTTEELCQLLLDMLTSHPYLQEFDLDAGTGVVGEMIAWPLHSVERPHGAPTTKKRKAQVCATADGLSFSPKTLSAATSWLALHSPPYPKVYRTSIVELLLRGVALGFRALRSDVRQRVAPHYRDRSPDVLLAWLPPQASTVLCYFLVVGSQTTSPCRCGSSV